MLGALNKLFRSGFLTPQGLWGFWRAGRQQGWGPMTLLAYAAHRHPHRLALHDGEQVLTYGQLLAGCEHLAASHSALRPGAKVAVLGRNQVGVVQAILALSKLGVDVVLLNVELAPQQLVAWLEARACDQVWCDPESLLGLKASGYRGVLTALPERCESGAICDRKGNGRIAVNTGGTSGRAKTASRKPAALQLFRPFCGLLEGLNLDACKSVYIATAFYHGYGLAFLFVALFWGCEVHIARRFVAPQVGERLRTQRIEALIAVPLMLARLGDDLAALKCIVTGGARLEPTFVRQLLPTLKGRLHNLYGSTEAGFSVLASPQSLAANPECLGRAIAGVRLKIRDRLGAPVAWGERGEIWVCSPWSVAGPGVWVATGDLGRIEVNGDVFLLGRADDMIVSGGENVYPDDVQRILVQHPEVQDAVVLGVLDPEFGQRLAAFVVLKPGALSEPDLAAWLRPQLARFQRPQLHFLTAIPIAQTGKVDRAALREYHRCGKGGEVAAYGIAKDLQRGD